MERSPIEPVQKTRFNRTLETPGSGSAERSSGEANLLHLLRSASGPQRCDSGWSARQLLVVSPTRLQRRGATKYDPGCVKTLGL